MSRRLGLEDILDIRAYEREREAFRDRIIELKKDRRVQVGPIITLVFENRETVHFQIQEMARAESMTTDRQIQGELDAYNPLIPEPGELSATLFLELRTEEELSEWLPKLGGIERSVEIRIGALPPAVVKATADPIHAEQLTREDVTASVHYVRFALTPEQTARFADGPVSLAIVHPRYQAETELSNATKSSVLADLRE